MKFSCKEITITDSEFGCGIHFADREEKFKEGQSYQEVMDSLGQYVSLERTYAEDQSEQDYYYVEFSDFGKSGELSDFEIELSHVKFKMNYQGESVEVELNEATGFDFEQVKTILMKVINQQGKLKVME